MPKTHRFCPQGHGTDGRTDGEIAALLIAPAPSVAGEA